MDANDLLSHIRSGEGLMTELRRCGGKPGRDVYEIICSFADWAAASLLARAADLAAHLSKLSSSAGCRAECVY